MHESENGPSQTWAKAPPTSASEGRPDMALVALDFRV
jgi:hypothetical protein